MSGDARQVEMAMLESEGTSLVDRDASTITMVPAEHVSKDGGMREYNIVITKGVGNRSSY